MRYLSLFSGIGGFELGIQQEYEELCNAHRSEVRGSQENKKKHKRERLFSKKGEDIGDEERPISKFFTNSTNQRPLCIGFSEIDKYAIQIYKKHFNHKNYGDITKIIAKELPDFDLIVGGFPCQSFSIAGKRLGFKDTRGTLFFDIARIIKEKRPKYLLLENVKGLLSHDNGRTFRTILSTLNELGYDIQWQVLNSKNFGIPQNRERVFIVGHIRGEPRPKVFPFGESNEENTMAVKIEGKLRKFGAAPPVLDREGISPTIVTAMGTGGNNMPCIKQLNKPKHSNNRVYSKEGLSPTLNTAQGGNRQPFIQNPKFKNLKKSKMAGSLTASQYKEPQVVNAIRRLTPTECERLQGFPDNFTKYGIDEKGEQIEISDTQKYKVLGNAVSCPVIEAIAKRLLL